MKIYVVCDLEGVAGVVDFRKQCMENGAYYQQAINMATRELNALIEGAIEGGATEIFAWPGHGAFPGGINVEVLHPECKLVMHAGDAGPVGYDESFDAMMLHGLHGMSGSGGVLAHSFYPYPKNIWADNLKIGEIALNMAGFGEKDIPTVLVTGDTTAIEETKALVPGVEGDREMGIRRKREAGSPEREENNISESGEGAVNYQESCTECNGQNWFNQAIYDSNPI